MGTGLKVATFQQRFSTLFEESEKTTTALSKELHISNQTVSAWKTGARSPKAPTVIAIAKYFRVNVAWLMGFDVDKYEAMDETNHIVIHNMDQFSHLMQYMTQEEYEYVVAAFDKAHQRMKEKGIEP